MPWTGHSGTFAQLRALELVLALGRLLVVAGGGRAGGADLRLERRPPARRARSRRRACSSARIACSSACRRCSSASRPRSRALATFESAWSRCAAASPERRSCSISARRAPAEHGGDQRDHDDRGDDDDDDQLQLTCAYPIPVERAPKPRVDRLLRSSESATSRPPRSSRRISASSS